MNSIQNEPNPSKKDGRNPGMPGNRVDCTVTRLRAELQHEEAKLRIFKIFLILFVLAVSAFLASSGLSFLRSNRAHSAALAAANTKLAALQSGLNRENLSSHDRAAKLAEIIAFRNETLLPLLKKQAIRAAEKENERDAEQIAGLAKPSLPEDNTEGKPGEDFIAPSAFLDMAGIPAGSFRMGGSLDNEMPVRSVTITHPFWIARTEVTNRQIQMLITGFQAANWGDFRLNLPGQPAVRVRWDQAVMFCRKLTELERLAGRLPAGYEYRLPTEAEWEYACRAGASTDYFWGTEFGEKGAKFANGLDQKSAERFQWRLAPIANAATDDGHRVSAPAASYLPNAWGLFDMSGNAAEWCLDWYDPKAYSDPQLSTADPVKRSPVGVGFTRLRPYDAGTWTTETACRVIRGGDWGMEPKKLRSAYRFFMPPNESDTAVGFRPVLAREIR